MEVQIETVREALAELSDRAYQARVWTGRDSRGEMSSFDECISRLYDDSGLELAFDRDQRVFGAGIDDQLRSLGQRVSRLDALREPDDIINDVSMERIRSEALVILRAVDQERNNHGQ